MWRGYLSLLKKDIKMMFSSKISIACAWLPILVGLAINLFSG